MTHETEWSVPPPHFFEDETVKTLWSRNYVYYTGIRRVLCLLLYVSLRENLYNSEKSSFRFPFEDFRLTLE